MSKEFLVPLSGKELVRKRVGDVTYMLKPCVGAVERQIKAIQIATFDFMPYVPEATEAVDNEHKGKSWKPGERVQVISEKAAQLAEDHFWERYSMTANDEKTAELFDVVCTGWEGADYELDEGEKPSDHVPHAVMSNVVEWYLSEMTLTDNDLKKSTRPRTANSRSKPTRKRPKS